MIDAALLLVMGVLYAAGIYLLLEKTLTKVLLGLMLLTNASNVFLLLAAGRAGLPAFYASDRDPADYLDALPQALVLTAIVISFATTALLLGMIHRSWALSRKDTIQNDAEDRRVAQQSDYDPEDDDAAPIESSEFEGSEEEREEVYRRRKAAQQEAVGAHAEETPGVHHIDHSHLDEGDRDRKEWGQ